jgi:hypothetical protein
MHEVWRRAGPLGWVVIPTNIGYTKQGVAVMGRGIAKEASLRFVNLAVEYGDFCLKYKERTPVAVTRVIGHHGGANILTFPVQPYYSQAPHLSWRQPADIKLVERSCQQLAAMLPEYKESLRIYIGDVGTANGLTVGPVRELIQRFFGEDERVTHIKGLR